MSYACEQSERLRNESNETGLLFANPAFEYDSTVITGRASQVSQLGGELDAAAADLA